MQNIELNSTWFRGAVSIETNESGLRPWRLPHEQLNIFAAKLVDKAGETAGVRLAFQSDTTSVELQVAKSDQDRQFDLVIEDTLFGSMTLAAGDDICTITHLPNSIKRIELYFSQKAEVTVKGLRIDDGSTADPLANNQPRWITYGSSISQCTSAESPAQTWPAIVARNKGWDLTCLGFAGQCHLEPMVARVIRDLQADVISLCLGINVMGGNSLNIRTFRSAIIGMVSIIREKHRNTPIILISPIYCPYRETDDNEVGMNLVIMREEVQEAVSILTTNGDTNLRYIDGLEIFGQSFLDLLPDRIHPNAEGYQLMAKHFLGKLEEFENDTIDFSFFDTKKIIAQAEASIKASTIHITDAFAEQSEGGIHDYYSNGDYWWPNPDTTDGLPYIRRDGESNPHNFNSHRMILRSMRSHVANLAAGYVVTGNEAYAEKAVMFLREFFLDEATKMNPHLLYAQAIPGLCAGRGIGIIDTLHLIDVPFAIEALKSSSAMSEEIYQGLQLWFADYLTWMSTHENGIEERDATNNHGVCWYVQAAAFAWFTNNTEMLHFCTKMFKESLLPGQMDLDGSFPQELARTKPYGYSIFVLDNMVTLCHILSTLEQNLWHFELPDGRGIRKGLSYLYPYMKEKSTWPYPPDVEHFEGWPAQVSSLLFAGLALENNAYIELWNNLDSDPTNEEVRRNIAIRQPLLWVR